MDECGGRCMEPGSKTLPTEGPRSDFLKLLKMRTASLSPELEDCSTSRQAPKICEWLESRLLSLLLFLHAPADNENFLSKNLGTRSARSARARATSLQCGSHARRKTGIEKTSDKMLLGDGRLLGPQLHLGGAEVRRGEELVGARTPTHFCAANPRRDTGNTRECGCDGSRTRARVAAGVAAHRPAVRFHPRLVVHHNHWK